MILSPTRVRDPLTQHIANVNGECGHDFTAMTRTDPARGGTKA